MASSQSSGEWRNYSLGVPQGCCRVSRNARFEKEALVSGSVGQWAWMLRSRGSSSSSSQEGLASGRKLVS